MVRRQNAQPQPSRVPLASQAKVAAALFKKVEGHTPHVQEPSAASSVAQPDAAAATDTVVQPPAVTTDADASQEQRTGLAAVEDSELPRAVACLEAAPKGAAAAEPEEPGADACEVNVSGVTAESESDDDDASPEKATADAAGTGVIATVAAPEKATADAAGTGVIAAVAGVPAGEKVANDEFDGIFDEQANGMINGESFASEFVSMLQNPTPKKRQLMREKSNTRMNDLSDVDDDETDVGGDNGGATDDKQESDKVAHTPPT